MLMRTTMGVLLKRAPEPLRATPWYFIACGT
jgi:hypothetical protein